MNYLKIIITACSVLSSSFEQGSVPNKISHSQYLDSNKEIECQRVETKKNEFVCMVHSIDKNTKKKKEEAPVVYKLVKVNESILFLTNDTKSQIYHINASSIVFHERFLSETSSSSKICVGKLEEKR